MSGDGVAAQSRLATYTTFKTEAALHRCTRYYAVLSVAISGGLNRARRELFDVALGKGIAILLPARPVRSLLKADRRRASKACQSGRRFIVRKPCARDHIPGDLFSLIVLGADFVRVRFRCSPIAPDALNRAGLRNEYRKKFRATAHSSTAALRVALDDTSLSPAINPQEKQIVAALHRLANCSTNSFPRYTATSHPSVESNRQRYVRHFKAETAFLQRCRRYAA